MWVSQLLSLSCHPCCCHIEGNRGSSSLPSSLLSLSTLPWMTGTLPSTPLGSHTANQPSSCFKAVQSGHAQSGSRQNISERHTTSNRQTGMHVILTSFARGEEDGLRHSTFCVKVCCFATMPLQPAYSLSRHLSSLTLCVYVFFFLILDQPPRPCGKCISPASLWLSTLCTWCTCVVYVYSSSDGGKVTEIGHLTAIRCQHKLPTASALQLWSPMAVNP